MEAQLCIQLLLLARNDLDIVDFLLSAGADINHLNTRGMSPLFSAAQGGHLKVIKLLVKKGANIHKASTIGISPLYAAVCWGHNEVVDYLIGKGVTFEATGNLAKVCKCCGAADAPLKCGLC
jgi:ankyrin repeat protein